VGESISFGRGDGGLAGRWRCWGRHVEQGEGSLQVDDAFPEEGEAVVEAAAAMVEGFVG
jgi:hypothetical protein